MVFKWGAWKQGGAKLQGGTVDENAEVYAVGRG